MRFKDSKKTEWDVSITVGAIRRVKNMVGVDLTKLEGPTSETNLTPLISSLGLDVELLVDVLFSVVKPQADEREITDEAFAERLDGHAADAGIRALWEAIADFTLPRRPDLAAGLRKQATMIDQEAKKAAGLIEKLDVEKLMSSNTATNSQASSASTPPPTRSGNSRGSQQVGSKRSGRKQAR